MIPSTRAEIARFRHRVFVEKLGWQVPHSATLPLRKDGEESDEYDHDDTVYVTLRGNEDAIVGCARLLPARNRYLLGDHFRHLVDDLQAAVDVGDAVAARDDEANRFDTPVWELSRFACDEQSKTERKTTASDRTQGARELLRAAVFTARALGAQRLIGVTFVSLARLFVRLGVPTHKLGAAYRIDGRWVAAYRIDIDAMTLRALSLGGNVRAAAEHLAPWGASCTAADVIRPSRASSGLVSGMSSGR
ncbi:acyl-homoserine-lactone synthase [Pandoraea sp. ISTKB]|uniref:acyl-homoserine-lactone synthase n=1 Tax=Pandoraea sp. ISTKB TaxID=1586708 RepID=UPI001F0A5929|nr:acyl-homoserine-lactone synthase [Pandoraea sp. ISTKB]